MVNTPLLSAQALEVYDQGVRVIGPIDFFLPQGGITVVIGPNGAGKTTFLKALHGLRSCRGALILGECSAARRPVQSFVFQAPIVLNRSVLDNIAYPLILHGQARKLAHKAAMGWAEQVGLGELWAQSALTLSLGEQQRLALARALITGPDILFLDEPCASLDGASTAMIETLVLQARQTGTTVVMISHNLRQAKRLADRILFMYKGQIAEDICASDFWSRACSPLAQRFLRGEAL